MSKLIKPIAGYNKKYYICKQLNTKIMEKQIRTLRADEIECRVQQVTEKGCVLLIYKDARVDMRILDETFGVDGWQRTHEVINGNLFCNIEIWSEDKKCWIKKQDVGTESNTEKEKGQASDAFKRACFNLGIGRELYEYPLIQIKLADNEFDKTTNKPTFNFKLKEWKWGNEFDENGVLIKLAAKDQNGNLRFNWKKQ